MDADDPSRQRGLYPDPDTLGACQEQAKWVKGKNSRKVQLDLQDKRLQAQAETSPGSTLLRQADDQLSEHHLPPSRRHPTRWSREEEAPFTDAQPRLYTFVSP